MDCLRTPMQREYAPNLPLVWLGKGDGILLFGTSIEIEGMQDGEQRVLVIDRGRWYGILL